MATGGTIPSSRTQSVTFYNTTGVIENRKNIYLAPRFSKYPTLNLVGKKVQSAYLAVFNQVCPPSSSYTGIEISSWSPQDRTLKVKGNIDDFRLVSEEGDCLNYFILTRNVTKGEGQQAVTKTYYYGFFITGVQQAGGSSVLLSIQPDDLTNVFYLHNEHVLTALDVSNDYEPFNEKMKNCYVNRQHYNRVRKTSHTEYEKTVDEESIHDVIATMVNGGGEWALIYEDVLNYLETVQFGRYSIYGSGQGDPCFKVRLRSKSDLNLVINEYDCYQIDLDGQSSYLTIHTSDEDSFNILWNNASYVITIELYPTYTISYEDTSIKQVFAGEVVDSAVVVGGLAPDNLRVFLNTEETFNYKYQLRDRREIFNTEQGLLTESEKANIRVNNNFENLPIALQKKIVMQCLCFVKIIAKEKLNLTQRFSIGGSTYRLGVSRGYGDGEGFIASAYPTYIYPTINVPEQYAKYRDYLVQHIKFDYVINGTDGSSYTKTSGTLTLESFKKFSERLVTKGWGEYILSMYIVKNSSLQKNMSLLYSGGNYVATFRSKLMVSNYQSWSADEVLDYVVEKGIWLVILPETMNMTSENTYYLEVYNDTHRIEVNASAKGLPMFLESAEGEIDSSISFEETMNYDLRNNYSEPILEAEPYSYYSISYAQNLEIILFKNRYYETYDDITNKYTLNYRYIESNNDALKVGIIPSYVVESNESYYFTEGLVVTLQSSLPIRNDSYYNFYYANMSQMKNQFAVNDITHGFEAGERFALTAPNAIIQKAGGAELRGGDAGGSAILEAGNQITQLASGVVDWIKSAVVTDKNQKAKLADMGRQPDVIKQSGSDVFYDLQSGYFGWFLNHYRIDELSYNSIAKLFERTGYQINLYDSLHTMDRVGWNFIKLITFDFVTKITVAQENEIRRIFGEGITLLHDKSYLTSGHNFETILEGGD